MAIILYVGMDVHKNSFSVCTFSRETEKIQNASRMDANVQHFVNYLNSIREKYPDEEVVFECGYEAGCLGYTLYNELTARKIKCTILAPSTMSLPQNKKKLKTDKRDAENIARCLALKSYSPVWVQTDEDVQVRSYIRMRDDFKLALKKVKQQILAFCLCHGLRFDGTKHHWTSEHIAWLHALKPSGIDEETLREYVLELDHLMEKLKRLDGKIEELAARERYKENVSKLSCFIGVKTHTALAVLCEIGDFNRFPHAGNFAAFLGLVPGEDSSGDKQKHLPITKTGNSHLRRLLVESAQRYGVGKIGYKSAALKKRQEGNSPEVIAYADKANRRLRQKYYHMEL